MNSIGETTNIQLMDYAKKLNLEIKVISKDQIKENLTNGNYIINLNNSYEKGSHWVGCIITNSTIYYFDSFGVEPLKEIIRIKKHILYNTYYIQDLKEKSCGYYALIFCYYLPLLNYDYKKFLSIFLQNKTDNKIILDNIIKQLKLL